MRFIKLQYVVTNCLVNPYNQLGISGQATKPKAFERDIMGLVVLAVFLLFGSFVLHSMRNERSRSHVTFLNSFHKLLPRFSRSRCTKQAAKTIYYQRSNLNYFLQVYNDNLSIYLAYLCAIVTPQQP